MSGAVERNGAMDFLIFVRERQAESEEVLVKAEEAWLTAKAVGTLLGADSAVVEQQFRSLFATGELLERDVSARFLRTLKDGSENEETFYSEAAVIALCLRMETPQARQFRRWSLDKLSNYVVKGLASETKIFQTCHGIGKLGKVMITCDTSDECFCKKAHQKSRRKGC